MWGILLATVVSAWTGWKLASRKSGATHRQPHARMCVDATTPDECEALLRKISVANDTTDEIAARLVRLFTRFPPRESSLQSLSQYTQRPLQPGSASDFATCTVYASQSIAIMSSVHMRPKPIARTATAP